MEITKPFLQASEAFSDVVAGSPAIGQTMLTASLAQGHILIDDIPGVGKTLMAQAFTRLLGGSFRRVQGTPDLLPGDISGSLLPDAEGKLVFRPGPLFANVVLFDELNRVSPRTQAVLFEAAEERAVSVDGRTHQLPHPFVIVATQNPLDAAGTFGLSSAAVDRFAVVLSPGRASPEDELEVIAGRRGRQQLDAMETQWSPQQFVELQREAAAVSVSTSAAKYCVELLQATREHPRVILGASTRAGVSLMALAKAHALMMGRSYVTADDISALASAALAHRIRPSEASLEASREIVAECVAATRAPTP